MIKNQRTNPWETVQKTTVDVPNDNDLTLETGGQRQHVIYGDRESCYLQANIAKPVLHGVEKERGGRSKWEREKRKSEF